MTSEVHVLYKPNRSNRQQNLEGKVLYIYTGHIYNNINFSEYKTQPKKTKTQLGVEEN